jgi:hypothetical protein
MWLARLQQKRISLGAITRGQDSMASPVPTTTPSRERRRALTFAAAALGLGVLGRVAARPDAVLGATLTLGAVIAGVFACHWWAVDPGSAQGLVLRVRHPSREGRLAQRYGLVGSVLALGALRLPWSALQTTGLIAGTALVGLGLYYHLVDPEPSGVPKDGA